MLSLRFKPLKNGKFSAYLDIYKEDEIGKKQREYEFLKIHLSQDYSDEKTCVKSDDKENLEIARAIKSQREVELLKGEHGLNRKEKQSVIKLLDFLQTEVPLKKTNTQVNSAMLKQVVRYVGKKKLTLGDTDTDWCERFKQFLLKEVNSHSTRSYLSALRNRFKISIEAFEHELNHGQIDHTFTVLGVFFVVF